MLSALQKELPFEIVRVDVTLDPAVSRRYQKDVPVVFIDGRRAFSGRVPEKEARRRLERALAQTEGSQAGEITPIPPRALRRVKVGFMAVAFLAIPAVIGAKLYDRLVRVPALVEASFEDLFLAEEGGGRVPGPVMAPDFGIETPDGKRLNIADVKGQVLFVNFWATWCPPCRDEMPSMMQLGMELARTYPGKFKMLAISIDDGWDPVRKFFESGMPQGILVGLDRDQKTTKAYYCAARGRCPENFQVPESYIIDKQGRLVAFVVNRRNWSEPAARRFLAKLIEG